MCDVDDSNTRSSTGSVATFPSVTLLNVICLTATGRNYVSIIITATAEEKLTEIWETPHTLHGWLSTVDHKKIGKRYLVTAFAFLIVGGLEALVMRLQLAKSNLGLLDPETYDQLFTMHSTTMIWWYAYPILAGFANTSFHYLLAPEIWPPHA